MVQLAICLCWQRLQVYNLRSEFLYSKYEKKSVWPGDKDKFMHKTTRYNPETITYNPKNPVNIQISKFSLDWQTKPIAPSRMHTWGNKLSHEQYFNMAFEYF